MTVSQRDAGGNDRLAIALLAGQALALGLGLVWVAIPSSAIFLDTYGSGALPYTYIGAAVIGAAASAVLTRSFRRRTLVRVTMRVLAGLAIVLIVAFGILLASGTWVTALLLAAVPTLIPVGFMLVVGQAGMMLDVRALKRFYGRVIAGFALGFVIGGAVAPVLLRMGLATEGLLALAAGVVVVFLALVWATERSFPAHLSAPEDVSGVRPTTRSLLADPYVVLIIAFQMLSAVESQWLDYLVFDRAATRYSSSEDLADFISRFTAIAYGVDIVFLLVVAGFLLRRFGLRYGLTANAVAVLGLLAATIVLGSIQPAGAAAVFVLVAATRATDLTLADGATRTSLGAAYQAVAPARRLAAQATVEGLAVPVAIGISGVVLIVVRSTVGTGGLALHVLTSAVVAVWIVVGLFVYRGYRTNLLANLRHRVLAPADLVLDDPYSLPAIDVLLDSADERDVRLGLHALATGAEADDLAVRSHWARLAADDRVLVRAQALEHLISVDPTAAGPAARSGLDHPDGLVRATSVRALATIADRGDVARAQELWHDPDFDVRAAAAELISRSGDRGARWAILDETHLLASSSDPREAVLAARVLASSGPGNDRARRSLRALLTRPEREVIEAALDAVRSTDGADLLDLVLPHLADRSTSTAAAGVLVRVGNAALPIIDDELGERAEVGRHRTKVLVRACRDIGGDGAIEVLGSHLADPDREVGLAVALALADVCPTPRVALSIDGALDAVIEQDLEHAGHTLSALVALGDGSVHEMVDRALRDELQLLRRRLVALLSVRYGVDGMDTVMYRLAGTDSRSHALALEWLDVTLVGVDRGFTALVDPALFPAERVRALARHIPPPVRTGPDVLHELVEDPDGRWRRPWLSACALLAAADAGTGDIAALTTRIPSAARRADEHSILEETCRAVCTRHETAQLRSPASAATVDGGPTISGSGALTTDTSLSG